MRACATLCLTILAICIACGCATAHAPMIFDNAIQPGAYIEVYTKPAKVEVLCVGSMTGTPTRIERLTSDQADEASLSLKANVDKVLSSLGADAKSVSKVHFIATNVVHYTASLQELQKRPPCTIAADRTKLGIRVELVTQAYVGDVTYTVEYSAGVNAQAKVAVAKQLEAGLQAKLNSTDDSTLQGKQIGWVHNYVHYPAW
jgi:hypothetical protein